MTNDCMAATVRDAELLAYREKQEKQEAKKKNVIEKFVPQQYLEEMVDKMELLKAKKECVLWMLKPFRGLFTMTVSMEAADVPITHNITVEGPPIHQSHFNELL